LRLEHNPVHDADGEHVRVELNGFGVTDVVSAGRPFFVHDDAIGIHDAVRRDGRLQSWTLEGEAVGESAVCGTREPDSVSFSQMSVKKVQPIMALEARSFELV
jgi:hypothetical protein